MKKTAFFKVLSCILAALLVVCSMPLSFLAAEGAKVTISSDVTIDEGVVVDDSVEFTYSITVNGEAYNGIATSEDGTTYSVENGLLSMPYNASAYITITDGSTYSIKRLEYDNPVYALIEESNEWTGEVSTLEYYVSVDGAEPDKITSKEFNAATDNGTNLVVDTYTDNDGNAYAAEDVDQISGYEINRKSELGSTSYEFKNYTSYYVKDSLEEHTVGITDASCTHTATKTMFVTSYFYANTLTGTYDGVADEAKTVDATVAANMAGTRTSCAKALQQNSLRAYHDHADPFIQEGKMAIVANNAAIDTCNVGSAAVNKPSSESKSDIENTLYAFTVINKSTSVYSTVEVEADKNGSFPAKFSVAPTGTLGIDYILYDSTVPTASQDAAFELKDINGNVLANGVDYALELKDSSLTVPIVNTSIGWTTYKYTNLKPGFYTITQTEAESGYKIDTTSYLFNVARDGSVTGENIATSSFDKNYASLANSTYSLITNYRVFKNKPYSIQFSVKDQNLDPVQDSEFLMISRNQIITLLGQLIGAVGDQLGNLNLREILDQLQGVDWQNVDVTTILKLILAITNLDEAGIAQITIPAMLTAKSETTQNDDGEEIYGVVSFNKNCNVLNALGTVVDAGISGEQLVEILKKYLGNFIDDSMTDALDVLAGLTQNLEVVTGMPDGNYFLINTKAPEGYASDSKVYTVAVSTDGTAKSQTGILFPVILEQINNGTGLDIYDIINSPEEFDKISDDVKEKLGDFQQYSDNVIDGLIDTLSGIFGDDAFNEYQAARGIKRRVNELLDSGKGLSDSIVQTLNELNEAIQGDVTAEWSLTNERYYVDINLWVGDCRGNDIGLEYTVTDSNGAEQEIIENTVTVPYGKYKLNVANAPSDAYELDNESKITDVTVDDKDAEYKFVYEYHIYNEKPSLVMAKPATFKAPADYFVACDSCGNTHPSVTVPVGDPATPDFTALDATISQSNALVLEADYLKKYTEASREDFESSITRSTNFRNDVDAIETQSEIDDVNASLLTAMNALVMETRTDSRGGSIRVGEVPGLRFGFKTVDVSSADVEEYGFLYVYDSVDVLTPTTQDVHKMVANNHITHNEGTEDEYTTFNLVFTKIPTSAYDTNVTACSYVVVDGITFYSEPITRNFRQVANAVLADTDVDQNTKDAINGMLNAE